MKSKLIGLTIALCVIGGANVYGSEEGSERRPRDEVNEVASVEVQQDRSAPLGGGVYRSVEGLEEWQKAELEQAQLDEIGLATIQELGSQLELVVFGSEEDLQEWQKAELEQAQLDEIGLATVQDRGAPLGGGVYRSGEDLEEWQKAELGRCSKEWWTAISKFNEGQKEEVARSQWLIQDIVNLRSDATEADIHEAYCLFLDQRKQHLVLFGREAIWYSAVQTLDPGVSERIQALLVAGAPIDEEKQRMKLGRTRKRDLDIPQVSVCPGWS
ncbi:MAG: hypothetical protein LBJ69_00210 [Holosporales bacterium]|jgi:hypothetical protein|nr:hypothetical protein [Holosporales bacterium]